MENLHREDGDPAGGISGAVNVAQCANEGLVATIEGRRRISTCSGYSTATGLWLELWCCSVELSLKPWLASWHNKFIFLFTHKYFFSVWQNFGTWAHYIIMIDELNVPVHIKAPFYIDRSLFIQSWCFFWLFYFLENGGHVVDRNRLGNVSPRRISGASSISGYFSDDRERHHSFSQVSLLAFNVTF